MGSGDSHPSKLRFRDMKSIFVNWENAVIGREYCTSTEFGYNFQVTSVRFAAEGELVVTGSADKPKFLVLVSPFPLENPSLWKIELEGKNVTITAFSKMVSYALMGAEILAKDGISAESHCRKFLALNKFRKLKKAAITTQCAWRARVARKELKKLKMAARETGALQVQRIN